MDVIVTAAYGAVLASPTTVYYVPTKEPTKIAWPAKTEERPELKRKSVAAIDASAGESVEMTPEDLSRIDGVVSFCGETAWEIGRASDWAQIEELVGPLRYRDDVENAAMYWAAGERRPRIPVRIISRGLGAVGLYLFAHEHRSWAVARALGLTYATLFEHIKEDVYERTPSFDWEDDV